MVNCLRFEVRIGNGQFSHDLGINAYADAIDEFGLMDDIMMLMILLSIERLALGSLCLGIVEWERRQ